MSDVRDMNFGSIVFIIFYFGFKVDIRKYIIRIFLKKKIFEKIKDDIR